MLKIQFFSANSRAQNGSISGQRIVPQLHLQRFFRYQAAGASPTSTNSFPTPPHREELSTKLPEGPWSSRSPVSDPSYLPRGHHIYFSVSNFNSFLQTLKVMDWKLQVRLRSSK